MITTQRSHAAQALLVEGFYFAREEHRWGKCPTYQHADGRIRFLLGTQIKTPKQVYEQVEQDWQPVAEADVIWKMHHMQAEYQRVRALHVSNWSDRAPEHRDTVYLKAVTYLGQEHLTWECWREFGHRVCASSDRPTAIQIAQQEGYWVVETETLMLARALKLYYRLDLRLSSFCGSPEVYERLQVA